MSTLAREPTASSPHPLAGRVELVEHRVDELAHEVRELARIIRGRLGRVAVAAVFASELVIRAVDFFLRSR